MLKAFNWELIAMEALNMSTLRRFFLFFPFIGEQSHM